MATLVWLTLTDSKGRRVKGKIDILNLPIHVIEKSHDHFELKVGGIDLISYDLANEGVVYNFVEDANGDAGTFTLSATNVITLDVTEA